MVIINLRDYYPWYRRDCHISVPDEVADILEQYKRLENAYWRRLFRYKAYYSLDVGDGIEKGAMNIVAGQSDDYEELLITQELYAAIASLPDKEAKHIYAHFILGMSKSDIAHVEGVSEGSIRWSINCGLNRLKKFFLK